MSGPAPIVTGPGPDSVVAAPNPDPVITTPHPITTAPDPITTAPDPIAAGPDPIIAAPTPNPAATATTELAHVSAAPKINPVMDLDASDSEAPQASQLSKNGSITGINASEEQILAFRGHLNFPTNQYLVHSGKIGSTGVRTHPKLGYAHIDAAVTFCLEHGTIPAGLGLNGAGNAIPLHLAWSALMSRIVRVGTPGAAVDSYETRSKAFMEAYQAYTHANALQGQPEYRQINAVLNNEYLIVHLHYTHHPTLQPPLFVVRLGVSGSATSSTSWIQDTSTLPLGHNYPGTSYVIVNIFILVYFRL